MLVPMVKDTPIMTVEAVNKLRTAIINNTDDLPSLLIMVYSHTNDPIQKLLIEGICSIRDIPLPKVENPEPPKYA